MEPTKEELDRLLGAGEEVGDYVVEGILGRGTFGTVYRGIQPAIGKQVAIKVLSSKYSGDPAVLSRFILEARAVNQIRHRNIIDVYTFGKLPDGRHFHVMELLEGAPLDDLLRSRGGRLELPEVFPVLRGVARALDAAHGAGIVHRDLKPANVFLAEDEEGRPFPKLLDFGIAKLMHDDLPRSHQTATGAAVGTPDYMSPEQCRGPDIDHRSDLYALGVLAYVLLSGELPFVGGSVVEVMMAHLTDAAPPVSAVAPELAPFDEPLGKALAKDPAERHESAKAFVHALEEAATKAGHTLPTADITLDPPVAPLSARPERSAMAATFASADGLAAPGAPRWWWGVGLIAAAAAVGALGFAYRSQTTVQTTALPVVAAAPEDGRAPAEAKPSEVVVPPAPEAPAAPVLEPAPKIEAAPKTKSAPSKRSTGLKVRGTPRGAAVWVNGKQAGRIPTTVQLPTGGRARIEVRASGFRPFAKTVAGGELRRLDVDLRRRPAAKKDSLEEPEW